MTDIRRAPWFIALAALFASIAAPEGDALAQAYPSKPVHIVVPYAAGGITDIVARALAARLTESLKQQFIIENKPAAGGIVGTNEVAKAAPDGYTLLVGADAAFVTAPHAYAKLPYDPLKDFRPVIEYGRYLVGLFVGAQTTITDLTSFVAQSKSAKDGLSIGLPGVGSVSHLYAQLLAGKTGAKLTYVPYRGDAPARLDLLAGNIQGIASTPDFGLIADGKARLIGSTGNKRWPQTPNVPTFAEAGYPDLVGFIVWGFAVPAGTPDDVVKVLNEATNHALKSERVKRVMVDNAYFVGGGTPEELWSVFNQQINEFGAVVRSGAVKFE